jgi:hypothetical protein
MNSPTTEHTFKNMTDKEYKKWYKKTTIIKIRVSLSMGKPPIKYPF